jgi:hypothetical protein
MKMTLSKIFQTPNSQSINMFDGQCSSDGRSCFSDFAVVGYLGTQNILSMEPAQPVQ